MTRLNIGMSIKVAARCNISCKGCFARHWMAQNNRYQLSTRELVYFLESTIDSRYFFRFITLSGGEPLLHPEIKRFVRLIKRSGVCDQIIMFTNGLKLPGLYYELPDVNRFVVSMII